MNRLTNHFRQKPTGNLSVFFTAGHPEPDSTADLLVYLEKHGADLVEIGMPYSDPLADGPTIQRSSKIALDGGMTLKKLFSQLSGIRERVKMPLVLMGYFNPVLQFGVENFCREAQKTGIDGLLLPDLPLDYFQKNYASIFEKYGLKNILLVTPQTSDERIRAIDAATDSFIYCVASASTTGTKTGLSGTQLAYFQRLAKLNLKNPLLAGFGISDRNSFNLVCENLNGAVVGSAFITALENTDEPLEKRVSSFLQNLRPAENSAAH